MSTRVDFEIQTFADGVWITNATWKRIKKFLTDHGIATTERVKAKKGKR